MIIYNVTIKVDETIAEDWLAWMVKDHIPEVMATGCFNAYKMVRLLEIDESEGSYLCSAIQCPIEGRLQPVH